MFLDEDLWILHGGRVDTDTEKERGERRRVPVEVSALDPATGETRVTHPAGLAHCFPPVATPEFMFAGELDMTDLKSGKVVANRITKANCSKENGWIPANGLIYTTPKHCTCWPMLRGFVAMAPAAPDPVEPAHPLTRGPGAVPDNPPAAGPADWPQYRADGWRSGSSAAAGPKALREIWRVDLADGEPPPGPILHDWRENPYVKGRVTQATIAPRRRLRGPARRARDRCRQHRGRQPPLAVLRRRPDRQPARHPPRPLRLRLARRLRVRADGGHRRTGLAVPCRRERRAHRDLRPGGVALAGAGGDAGLGRHRLRRGRSAGLRRRRRAGLRARRGERRAALDAGHRPPAAEGLLRELRLGVRRGGHPAPRGRAGGDVALVV